MKFLPGREIRWGLDDTTCRHIEPHRPTPGHAFAEKREYETAFVGFDGW